MNICECGCNNECRNRFLPGHSRKGKSAWNKGLSKLKNPEVNLGGPKKKIVDWHLCKCGCGELVKYKFAFNHHNFLKKGSHYLKHTAQISNEIKTCLCGCGKIVKNKFATGHYQVWNKYNNPKAEIRHLCECGCNNLCKRRFVDGHNGKCTSNPGQHKFPYVSSDGTIKKMRSSWEVLYAQYLDVLGVVWVYEPRQFKLSNGKRYWPDFYLPDLDEYHEVKGFMSNIAQEKLDLFQKEYSQIKFKLLMQPELQQLGVLKSGV